MQTNDHAVKLLNSLIETTLDSAHGYQEAAKTVKDPQLRTLFASRAQRRQQISSQLQGEVRTFGGDPHTDQSMAGKTRDSLINLKNAVMAGSDKSVVDEVERGEDVIKRKFEKAAADADLPPSAREVVTRFYGDIKSDHDDISRLKHQLH
jgi:uncharacterized protein (TIGR02284 family)